MRSLYICYFNTEEPLRHTQGFPDLRGLMAEEYVDNGVWSAGSTPFRLVKAAEGALLRRADRIVVLTEKLRARLVENPEARVSAHKITVIPCCTDLSRYDGSAREA